MRRAHSRYSQAFNRRYGRSGHLWQNRFFSCPLGAGQLLTALAYGDQNPARAGLVGRPEQYPWSSAAAHLEGGSADELLDVKLWRSLPGIQDWKEVLYSALSPQARQRLQASTYAGLPCGDEEFIAGLEMRFQRRLTKGKPGRKPKAEGANA